MPQAADADGLIEIEVACALPAAQIVRVLRVPRGTTLLEAVRRSGLLEDFPELDPLRDGLGVFGRHQPPGTPVRAGDRVEIYRPLQVDPKEARRRRAAARGRRR